MFRISKLCLSAKMLWETRSSGRYRMRIETGESGRPNTIFEFVRSPERKGEPIKVPTSAVTPTQLCQVFIRAKREEHGRPLLVDNGKRPKQQTDRVQRGGNRAGMRTNWKAGHGVTEQNPFANRATPRSRAGGQELLISRAWLCPVKKTSHPSLANTVKE
ncbi:unnamed protein product [Diplocarpon coronariae]|nr:hypothetical protein JHW43_001510 [Diplocarpon mali]